mgnify:CR=1 FL=1
MQCRQSIAQAKKLIGRSKADDAVTVATYESAQFASWWIEHKDTNPETIARNVNLRESK